MNIQVIGVSDVVGGEGMTLINYPLKVVNDVNKHRHKYSMRSSLSSSSSSSSMQLSSLSSKTDEKKITLDSKIYESLGPRSALNQENTVGIIGGVSVLSTLIFLEKLVWLSSRNGGESVPFIVCSDPVLRQEAYKPNMPYKCYNYEHSIYSGSDDNRVVENLRRKRAFLEDGGARCIVMPCHVAHAWHGEISQGCQLPFLHAAECVGLELKEARFKPLEAGSAVKIGVLATEPTLTAGVYQEKLQNEGFEVVLPDKATMDHVINPAIEAVNRKDKEGACNLLRIAIQLLLVRAANTVILASDELQGLLPHDDPLSKKCINPMDSLATAAVRWAKSAKAHKRNVEHA